MDRYMSVHDRFDKLNINHNLIPGTKFNIINDDKTYVLIGYGINLTDLICIDENNLYNGSTIKNIILSRDNVNKIIYTPYFSKYQIQNKIRFYL
jgi:hypothetical protein